MRPPPTQVDTVNFLTPANIISTTIVIQLGRNKFSRWWLECPTKDASRGGLKACLPDTSQGGQRGKENVKVQGRGGV